MLLFVKMNNIFFEIINKYIMDLELNCPHCDLKFLININEINCGILRHGAYIYNLEPINPHLPKDQCDKLVTDKLIIGCGKPIQIIFNNNGVVIAIKCDYV